VSWESGVAYSENPEIRFFLGSIAVDGTVGVASVDGVALPLGKKVVATLVALYERAGEVVPKATLLASAWGDSAIDDSSLWQNIHVLRGVLAKHAPMARVETVKGRGYRLRLEPVVAIAPAVPVAERRRPAWSWPFAVAIACAIVLGGVATHRPHPQRTIILLKTDGTSLPPLPPLPD